MSFIKHPLFLAVLGGLAVGSAVALNVLLFDDDDLPAPPPEPQAEQQGETAGTATADGSATDSEGTGSVEPTAQTQASDGGNGGTAATTTAETGDGTAQTATGGATQTASVPDDTGEPATTPETTAPAPAAVPTFDVVRITQGGDTVIAGRAPPGARVEILDGDEVIGTVTADKNGEWVFVPDAPLPPGQRAFALRTTTPEGETADSDQVVTIVVPERDSDEGALAVASSRSGSEPSRVLQKPGQSATSGFLTVDAIDYDEEGRVTISGSAEPGKYVNVYLDNTFMGSAAVDEAGRWRLTLESRIKPGRYELRADQVDDKGAVEQRLAMPFFREGALPDLKPGSFVVVQPGNSLWRIARRTYGHGLQYTAIYAANDDQIRDPDLIYPGQIFSLPATN